MDGDTSCAGGGPPRRRQAGQRQRRPWFGGRLGSGSGGRGRGDGGRLGSGSGGRGRGDGGRLGSGSGGRGRGDVQSLIVQSLIAVCTPSASPNPTTCHRRLIRGSIVTMSRRNEEPFPGSDDLLTIKMVNYRSSSHSHWRPRVLNLGTSTNSSGVIDPCGIGTKERSETPPFWIKRCCKSRGTPAMVLRSRLTPSLKQSRALRTKYSSIVNS